jgi:NAD kinase
MEWGGSNTMTIMATEKRATKADPQAIGVAEGHFKFTTDTRVKGTRKIQNKIAKK